MKTYRCPNSDGQTLCPQCQTYGLHDLLPPRRYVLNRKEDISGVSGKGIVAEAVQLNSGKVVVSWLVAPYSISLHDSLAAAIQVHGHNGATTFDRVD